MATPRISVVIPSFNRPEVITSLLSLLAKQTLAPEEFEVIVVDDGSPEPLVLDPEAYPFALTLRRQDNAGPGAARNTAFEHCRAPLLLILNDDALPAPDLIEGHLAAHEEVMPKTAVMGAFPFSANALRSPFVQLLAASDLLFPTSGLYDREYYDWRYFWTCNISLPLEGVLDVGGFDESLHSGVMEDVELGYRLEQQGWRVHYREDLYCEHEHTLTPESYFNRMRHYGRNLILMWKRHRDPAILGIADEGDVDVVLRRLQLIYEQLRPTYAGALERLNRLQSEHFGKQLPEQIKKDALRVVDAMRWVPTVRGFGEGLHGRDPEVVATRGPAAGQLTSLVLVSYNGLDNTRNCLDALRAHAEPDLPTEILVVDNGSEDGSVEYLRSQPDVQLIENSENLGAPRARNQAIPHARGEWLVFLDNDVVVYPGWLRRLRTHAEIDPCIGCVVPVADRAAHGQQVKAPKDPAVLPAFAAQCAQQLSGRAVYKQIFSSLLVLVRRDVIERIGGFDERFSPWGFEDDDFALRVHLAGYRTRLAKDVFVHHAHYDGPKSERHQRLLERNWRRFSEKWGGGKDTYGVYDFLAPVMARTWTDDALRVAPGSEGTQA